MLPITDDDLRRWQLRKADRLATLLKETCRAQLPPLMWTVHTAGPLVGQTSQRDAFEAWAKHLRAAVSPEYATTTRLTLRAQVTPEGHNLPEIVILAYIAPDD